MYRDIPHYALFNILIEIFIIVLISYLYEIMFPYSKAYTNKSLEILCGLHA